MQGRRHTAGRRAPALALLPPSLQPMSEIEENPSSYHLVMALLEGGRERAGRGPFCPRPGRREGISFLILA